MARFASKIPLWAIMLLCAVMVAALGPFAISKRHESFKALLCNQCGVRLWVSSDRLADSSSPAQEKSTFEHTSLSRWFSARISTNCQHSWQTNSRSGRTYATVAGIRLWNISGASGSSPTPALVRLSADDLRQLENLLRQSPDACRNFIRARLQGKEGPEE